MNLSDYDIFIMNIRLLNYNSNDINNKLLKNPFSKSNNTLMCNIIHFLLLSYDNNLNETLRLCYPVVTLSDFKLFKDTVYPLLEQILPPSIWCIWRRVNPLYFQTIYIEVKTTSTYIIKKNIEIAFFYFENMY